MMSRFFASLALVAGLGLVSLAHAAGFGVETIVADAERDQPDVCITFSADIERPAHAHYDDFVHVEPKVDLAFTAEGRRLCLAGPVHGRAYRVLVRKGLAAADGARLAQDRVASVEIADRQPSVAFRPGGYVLPTSGPRQLVLRTVNVHEVKVRILRVADRGLVGELAGSALARHLSARDVERLADTAGEEVFRGHLAILDGPNRAIETGLSLDEALANGGPGLFIAVAERKGERDPATPKAAQWFVVSDLGLVTYAARDGLTIAARSLSSAQPVQGVNLNLVARNNKELGRALTSPEGLAHFDWNLLRGQGGNAPRVVVANNGDSDFTFLDLAQAGIPLGDATNPPAPGANDAYVTTPQTVYRAGMRVDALALMRDDAARAVEGAALTLRLVRPDGAEAARVTTGDEGHGGYHAQFDLPETAPPGRWTLEAYVDPKAPAVGGATFDVADPIPARVRLHVQAPEALVAGREAPVAVTAESLTNGPIGALPLAGSILVMPAERPFPAFAEYRFGREDERVEPRRIALPPAALDPGGQGRLNARLSLDDLPRSSVPLKAILRVTATDLEGRPVTAQATTRITGPATYLGLKPGFVDNRVADQSAASVDLVAVNADGQPLDRAGLAYELVAEEVDYLWTNQAGAWTYREIVRDRRVAGGALAVKAAGPTPITTPALSQGRYRLSVLDAAGRIEASLRFQAGQWAQPAAGARPDAVAVRVDPALRRAGDSVKVFIKPPFDAQVLLALADDRVRETRTLQVPAEGAEIDVKIPDEATAGLHVLATAFGEPAKLKGALAARALGRGWIALDPSPRRLEVSLAPPATSPPGPKVSVPVTIQGLADGDVAYVVLAATAPWATPPGAPATFAASRYFLGLRPLGVEIHDLYGRLIDSRGVTRGQLRAGGDSTALGYEADDPALATRRRAGPAPAAAEAPPPGVVADEEPPRLVGAGPAPRLIGPIKVGAGLNDVPIPLPEVDGTWTLSAIAWSADKVGEASAALSRRGPVGIETHAPRRLGLGDAAPLPVTLRAGESAYGDYRLTLASADGLVAIAGGSASVSLTKETPTATLVVGTVTAGAKPGRAGLVLTLDGPAAARIERRIEIDLSATARVVNHRQTLAIEPGKSANLGAAIEALARDLDHGGLADVTLSPAPTIDVPGLLRAAARLEPQSAEDLAEALAPSLVAGELDGAPGADRSGQARDLAQRRVAQLAALQDTDGAFPAIAEGEAASDWVTAHAMDMLLRARDRGFAVPAATLDRGLQRLGAITVAPPSPDNLAAQAYAYYLLARARVAEAADLQTFAAQTETRLPSPLARAQLAAGLAALGDGDRARRLYATLGPAEGSTRGRADHGSALRDLAGALALAAEGRILRAADLAALAEEVAARAARTPAPSAAETAALILAAPALTRRIGAMTIAIDGHVEAESAQPRYRTIELGATAPALKIDNRGKKPIQVILSVTGPVRDQGAAGSDGATLRRALIGLDGKPLDATRLARDARAIVVLEGEARVSEPTDLAITDPLPAGFEIEGAALSAPDGRGVLGNLTGLTRAEPAIPRGDAYRAHVRLDPRASRFKLAYLVRARHPGQFTWPGASLRDPDHATRAARTAPAKVAIAGD